MTVFIFERRSLCPFITDNKFMKVFLFLLFSFLLNSRNFAETLNTASSAGDLEKVKLLILTGADINEKDKQGCTACIQLLNPAIWKL